MLDSTERPSETTETTKGTKAQVTDHSADRPLPDTASCLPRRRGSRSPPPSRVGHFYYHNCIFALDEARWAGLKANPG